MIFKSELVDAINSLSEELLDLCLKVEKIERRVNMLSLVAEAPKKKTNTTKSKKAKSQPRTKDGKFAKKK